MFQLPRTRQMNWILRLPYRLAAELKTTIKASSYPFPYSFFRLYVHMSCLDHSTAIGGP